MLNSVQKYEKLNMPTAGVEFREMEKIRLIAGRGMKTEDQIKAWGPRTDSSDVRTALSDHRMTLGCLIRIG
jgi:hypothetical protein